MIQTVITNNLHTGRTIRFAGVWVDAGATVILDGCYPDASKFRNGKQSFDAEIASGAVSVMYVTDIETISPAEFAKLKGKTKRTRKKAEGKKAEPKKEKAPEPPAEDEEGDEEVFTKGSIEDVMGKAKQVAGTVSETVADGETAKLAKRMEMDVAEVDADPKSKKNVTDPLLQAGSVVGEDNWPNITDAAQKALEKAGISKAEASLIKGTGSDGRLIQKDVKAYLAKKNGE